MVARYVRAAQDWTESSLKGIGDYRLTLLVVAGLAHLTVRQQLLQKPALPIYDDAVIVDPDSDQPIAQIGRQPFELH